MELDSTSGARAPAQRARLVAGAVVLVAVLGAGLIGGWTAARQGSSAAAGHGHDEHAGHDHGPAPTRLTAHTLANLGVVLGEVQPGDFVRTVEVPAEVAALPPSERPLVSPVAGIVRRVLAVPGASVAAGAVVAEVLRDAFPPAALSLTEDILKPLNEAQHEAAVAVRKAALDLALAAAERERLAPSGAGGAERVAGRVLREAEYAEQRARLELANARHEAERHGMTEEEIARLERGEGEIEVPDVPDVQRVLARNRLWSAEADALLALLPEVWRASPHALAVLGELVGTGRLTPELVAAVRAAPRLAEGFLDVAGLVQQGTTPAALADLAQRGALDPVVHLLAPGDGVPAWDVLEVPVRPGMRVEAGAAVARLRDDRLMALHLRPSPSDLDALAAALREGLALRAEPLVAGAGAAVEGVLLVALTGRRGDEPGGALATAPNALLDEREAPGGGRARTWALRPGQGFAVLVPVGRSSGRFVLPADAIAYRAAEAVVLMADGDAFKVVPVRLEHHDAKVAVVAPKGGLFPGDRIAIHGAPALGMALLAGQSGADPHAGHNH